MALRLIEEGARHLEDLINAPSSQAWAKSNFDLEKSEFQKGIAWGVLHQYAQKLVEQWHDPQLIMAHIEVSYQCLELLEIFENDNFPGSRTYKEIAFELDEIAPEFSEWLLRAGDRWVALMHKKADEARKIEQLTQLNS